MHIKINHSVLSDALKKVEKVVNAKHNIPILQGIYLEATNDELIFIGSDSNESFRFHVPVDGDNVDVCEPGKTVLPKQVTETVKRFKKEITLKLDGFTLLLQSGRSKFNLNTFDPEEFPKLPDFAIEESTLSLKGTDLSNLIKKTGFAAADSEIRPILTGVCLDLLGDCMQMVCTDSHRLGKVQVKNNSNRDLKFVIPAKSLEKLNKTFDLQEDVHIYCESENQLIFRSGSLVFYCRLLEGTYPDTSRLIPQDFKAEMKINRKVFLDEIEIIRGIANNADNGQGGVIKLHVNGAATISSYTAQTGKGESVVDYESLEGEDNFTISFSGKYIVDALKAIDDEYVNFKFNGEMRPFLLTPCDSEYEELQLVLPVRTQ